MKRITVTPICGNPYHEEEVVGTIEHTVTLNNRKPAVIDMCAQCESEVLPLLIAFIEDGSLLDAMPKRKRNSNSVTVAVQPSQQVRRGRQRSAPDIPDSTCPECGKDDFKTRGTRNRHLRVEHGTSIVNYP